MEQAGAPGRLERLGAATVPAADRGLTLGDGLFETVLVASGRAPLLARHLARLLDSAALLGYGPLPWDAPALAARAARVVAAAGPAPAGALRITMTRGPGRRGYTPPPSAQPTLAVWLQPLPPAPAGPWRAVTASVCRRPHPILTRVKHTSALELVWARAEAAAAGADEAILLNTDGNVAEGAATNLFAVADGVLHTPDLDDGCLPGVARAVVLELAAARGVAVRAGALPPAALRAAGEAFATNALLGPVPLAAVAGLPGGGAAWAAPGPLTLALAAAWQAAVGSQGSGAAP